MKTNLLLFLLFTLASTSCVEIPQSNPASLENLLDSTSAPLAKYDPDFQFDYPVVAVAGGIFRMGNTNGKKGYDADECAHLDTVNTFKIGVYEVSKYQWMQVMGNNPGAFPDCLDCPANYISWHDAKKFIEKLNAITKRRYRLPTEAEWEYAARGGAAGVKQNFIYAGGNNLKKVAWYNENSDKKLHPVGQKSPNALGIYDLSGNVREWCEDYYRAYPGCEVSPAMSLTRTCRGGSWSSTYFACRVSERMGVESSARYLNMGFRLAHD
jgi:formylglycine-generating enzyme required for sulfatase activity